MLEREQFSDHSLESSSGSLDDDSEQSQFIVKLLDSTAAAEEDTLASAASSRCPPQLAGVAQALVSSVAFSAYGACTKLMGGGLDRNLVNLLVCLVVLVLILPWLVRHRALLGNTLGDRRALGKLALIGLLEAAANYLIIVAFLLAPVGDAIGAFYIIIVLVFLLETCFVRGGGGGDGSFSLPTMWAVVLALAGALLLLQPPHLASPSTADRAVLLGTVCALICALLCAVAQLLSATSHFHYNLILLSWVVFAIPLSGAMALVDGGRSRSSVSATGGGVVLLVALAGVANWLNVGQLFHASQTISPTSVNVLRSSSVLLSASLDIASSSTLHLPTVAGGASLILLSVSITLHSLFRSSDFKFTH